jgi:hypothetical protein
VSAARTQLPPVDIARAHLDGQRRLRDDAAKQLTRAATGRADAERAHGAAATAHTKALATSAERPEDEKALDALSRAAAKLQRERATLDAKIKAHEQSRGELAAFEGHVDQAERDHERAKLEAEIADPKLLEVQHARGRRRVELVAELLELESAHRKDVTTENERVRRARELGSAIDFGDGLPEAFGVASALLARGVDVNGFAQPVAIAWTLAVPHDRHAPPLGKGVLDLVALVLEALSRPPSINGTAALRSQAEAWRPFRSVAECSRVQTEAAEAATHRHPEPAHAVDERERLTGVDREAAERRPFGTGGPVVPLRR